jgi:hypothetical protein
MNTRRDYSARGATRQARGRNIIVSAHSFQRQPKRARRSVVDQMNLREPFAPPEDWYEPVDKGGYRIVVQPPGPGYRHVVTPQQISDRLSLLPSRFLSQLEVIQLSRMTRKKQCFPCYGMQWGNSLYLYPLEETLIEQFDQPPGPSLVNEARMYGGRWEEPVAGLWTLRWSEEAAQDFYLNNILIHELGHLVDDRNTSYADRERFAEWFAVEHGYRARVRGHRRRKVVRRRHHAK